jgi:hypothetical protein
MLRRLMSWCVPDTALEMRVENDEVADVDRALAPYEHEAAAAETRFSLHIVNNQ